MLTRTWSIELLHVFLFPSVYNLIVPSVLFSDVICCQKQFERLADVHLNATICAINTKEFYYLFLCKCCHKSYIEVNKTTFIRLDLDSLLAVALLYLFIYLYNWPVVYIILYTCT